MAQRLAEQRLVECSAGNLHARSLDLSQRSIEFVCSTEALDSHGTIIVQDWDLKRYLSNPVVLLEHGRAVGGLFSGSGERDIDKLPIARSENVRIEGNTLRMRVVFPAEGRDERSDAVWRAIEDGRLNAVSVGFLPGEMNDEEIRDGDKIDKDGKPVMKTVTRISKNVLYELSVVGLPANPEAVAIRAMSVRNMAVRSLMNREFHPLVISPKAMSDVKEALAALRKINEPGTSLAPVLEAAPAAVPTAEKKGPSMDPELLKKFVTLLSLDAKASDAEVYAAVERACAFIALTRDLLGVAGDEAAVTKAIADLSVAKPDASLVEKCATLEKSLSEVLDREVDREVAFIVDAGERGIYGLGKGQNRKALRALRKLDAKGFAEDYKAALDGLKSFDDVRLFQLKTVDGAVEASVASASPKDLAPPMTLNEGDATDRLNDLDSRVTNFLAVEKAAGRTLSRSEAYDLVARGRDLAAR